MTVCKMKNSRMLQKASDDRSNLHRLRSASNARAQAAEASNDEVDRYAILGSIAQCLNDLRVLQLVHLCDDTRWAAQSKVFCFSLNPFANGVSSPMRYAV